MKHFLKTVLALALLLGFLAGSVCAEVMEAGAASGTTGKASAKMLTLKRGKTVYLWVYPFASTTQFYQDCGKEVPVKGIKFSGTSGTVKAKVTSGSSWLKAKKTSTGWTFSVTGKNLTKKDKNGVIRISDKKGTFATIRVTRGGTAQFSQIYSTGISIYAWINSPASHPDLYVYRWIFDASGKKVSKTKLKLSGNSFRDTAKETHLDYTYIYTVGYYAEATGKGMLTGAAGVWLSDPYENIGQVKKMTAPENGTSVSWLYGIVH